MWWPKELVLQLVIDILLLEANQVDQAAYTISVEFIHSILVIARIARNCKLCALFNYVESSD